MKSIDPNNTPTGDVHQYLLGCVSPRPIAFVSTIDEEGNPNLAPYSFFNAFSSNPPTVVFSSNRRVRDNTTKDTLHNVMTTGEVVINMVSYDIVRQMTVTSIEYPAGVSEFEKAGLTPIPSDMVRPFRVKESPAHLECKVQDVIKLGEEGGAGHLIICKVVKIHVAESVLDQDEKIDPHKIDLMGRMGRAFYVRASGEAVSSIFQSVLAIGIGYDQLPESFKSSTILSANNLGQLATLTHLPSMEEARSFCKNDPTITALLQQPDSHKAIHEYAKQILEEEEDKEKAALVLMGAS